MLFTGEEQGLHGSRTTYVEKHKDELPKISLCLVHDTGTGKVIGIGTQGRAPVKPILETELVSLKEVGLKEINMHSLQGSDHQSFEAKGDNEQAGIGIARPASQGQRHLPGATQARFVAYRFPWTPSKSAHSRTYVVYTSHGPKITKSTTSGYWKPETCFWLFDNIFWKKGRQSGSWPDWISNHAKLPLRNVSIRRNPETCFGPRSALQVRLSGFPRHNHIQTKMIWETARGNTESGVSDAEVTHSCAIYSPKSSPECRSAYLRNERSPSPEYPCRRETLLDLREISNSN